MTPPPNNVRSLFGNSAAPAFASTPAESPPAAAQANSAAAPTASTVPTRSAQSQLVELDRALHNARTASGRLLSLPPDVQHAETLTKLFSGYATIQGNVADVVGRLRVSTDVGALGITNEDTAEITRQVDEYVHAVEAHIAAVVPVRQQQQQQQQVSASQLQLKPKSSTNWMLWLSLLAGVGALGAVWYVKSNAKGASKSKARKFD